MRRRLAGDTMAVGNVSLRRSRFLTGALVLALGALPGVAREYYVSPEGSDANDGADSRPLQTIQAAAGRMVPGDICYVKSGIYSETVAFPADGEAGSPIRLQAFPGDEVIVTAADPVTGWAPYEGAIYRTPVTTALAKGESQLFIDGRWYHEARFPNVDDYERRDCTERLSQRPNRCSDREALATAQQPSRFPGYGNDIMTPSVLHGWVDNYRTDSHDGWPSTDGEMIVGWGGHGKELSSPSDNPYNILFGKPRDHWKGAILWARGWWWSGSGLVIESWDGASHRGSLSTFFKLASQRMRWFRDFVLIGHYDFIDLPGEWVIDDGYLYLYKPPSVNLEDGSVYLKQRNLAFDLGHRAHIELSGFTVMSGGVQMDSASHCIIDDCHFSSIAHHWYDSLWTAHRSSGDPVAIAEGRRGILLSGQHNRIQNCSFIHSSANAILIRNEHNIVDNNYFFNINYRNSYAATINGCHTGCEVTRNTMLRTARSHLQSLSDGTVSHNKLYDAMMLSGDGGTFYVVAGGIVEKSFEIAYNWFKGCYGEPSTYLYTDFGCTIGAPVHHNVFFDTPWAEGKFIPTTACGPRFSNNTWLAKVHDRDWEFEIKDTAYLDQPHDKRPWANNLNAAYDKASWLFTDTLDSNFTLREGSPAIDAGIVIPGITDGYTGQRPDLGAYEYGAARWVPGHTWGSPPDPAALWSAVSASGSGTGVRSPTVNTSSLTVTRSMVRYVNRSGEPVRLRMYTARGAQVATWTLGAGAEAALHLARFGAGMHVIAIESRYGTMRRKLITCR